MSFAGTAVLAVVVIGFLARIGGFEAVGVWSLLNAVLMMVLLGDLGLMNALTHQVATQGTRAAAVTLRWLLWRLLAGAGIGLVVCAALWFAGLDGLFYVLPLMAGVLQLAANWVITMRLGQHQQFWFQAKNLLRAAVQTALVLLFYSDVSTQGPVILGLALLGGAVAELAMAILAFGPYRTDFAQAAGHRPDPGSVVAMLRGFGSANVLQRLQEPLWRFVVTGIGGEVGLGLFTVARRLPLVLCNAANEMLRVLLPGLGQLLRDGEKAAARRLMRDALLIQFLFTIPAAAFLALFLKDFVGLWLGPHPGAVVDAGRVLALGAALNTIAVPWFWALQASGHAGRVALATGMGLSAGLAMAVGLLMLTGNGLMSAAFGVVLGQTVVMVSVMVWSHRMMAMVLPVLHGVNWRGVALCWTGLGIVALLALGLTGDMDALSRLITALPICLTGLAAIVIVQYRLKMLRREVPA